MNILVFGKDGQLGKAFQGLFEGEYFSAKNQVHYIGRAQCDLSNPIDLSNLLTQSKPDLIINAAAYTAVDKAESEVELAYAINSKAPELMALYAAAHSATFLHYSTDYVFDGNKEGVYLEDDLRNPLGIYGQSKAAGEEAVESAFASSSSGEFAIFRTSWVYGEGGNFIRTILRLAKEREELKVIHDQHGVPTGADWLARVSLDLSLDQQMQLRIFSSGIYHAVPTGETSWHGLAKVAAQAAIDAGIMLKVSPEAIKPILAIEYPLPAPRPMNSRMGNAKLQLALEQSGDMSKLQHWNEAWDLQVQSYVSKLAKDGLI
ncbi:dTDP-4-dehydrorhamnose reductase [Polynucleobacter alcilacus]|uniref:dTDP-4-dehydrorhamnose reductase n=1 Tax=Polynucleobacter alcilacus TaxID=1819739 RepID=UPI001C0C7F4F|nr:dTDP-4-dehydrorhamnose reductase [Polynucleobacter alcilacus]MBU3568104.1 dTDP-4-dehydrorhamnose reductase [Polynucleobacter alcilacus]